VIAYGRVLECWSKGTVGGEESYSKGWTIVVGVDRQFVIIKAEKARIAADKAGLCRSKLNDD